MKNSLQPLSQAQPQSEVKAAAFPVTKPVLRVAKAALLTTLVALVWVLSSTYALANGDQIIGSWITPKERQAQVARWHHI